MKKKINTLKKLLIIFIFILIIAIVSSIVITLIYSVMNNSHYKENTVGYISYDNNPKLGYTIYIEENNEYVPYLVLSNDYKGNTLFLRKYVLDEPKPYRLVYNDLNDGGRFSAYYENNFIDNFLSNEFINSLSSKTREVITESEITITAKQSLGVFGKETTTIKRKIFLLSFSELNGRSRTLLKEANPLTYFKSDNKNRIAYDSKGEACNWWLRTPGTGANVTVCAVAPDGTVGPGGTIKPKSNGNGMEPIECWVRPAFCIPSNIGIKKIYNKKMNEEIYVLDI